jgi:hypothetical protein
MKNIKTFEGFWDFLIDKKRFKRQEIISICHKLGIKNYTINDDSTVDVNGDLRLYLNQDKVEITKTLINFNKVDGDVDLSNFCNITGVNQIPFTFNEVTGTFILRHNKLVTLKGCPKKVGGDFNAACNLLNSLEGGPEKVGGNFIVNDNLLHSLVGSPRYVGYNFDASNNSIESLEGITTEIGGYLNIRYNKIKSFDNFPNCKIHKYDFLSNPIYLIFVILDSHLDLNPRQDISEIVDFFVSCDPIHPSQTGDPILHLDRLETFITEVTGVQIDINKEIENIHIDNFNGIEGSVRFVLEYYYDIRY